MAFSVIYSASTSIVSIISNVSPADTFINPERILPDISKSPVLLKSVTIGISVSAP